MPMMSIRSTGHRTNNNRGLYHHLPMPVIVFLVTLIFLIFLNVCFLFEVVADHHAAGDVYLYVVVVVIAAVALPAAAAVHHKVQNVHYQTFQSMICR